MSGDVQLAFDVGLDAGQPAPPKPPKLTPAAAPDPHPPGDDDRAGAKSCGHTELTLECECGQAVAAWWAETKRRLAESSPSRAFLMEGPG
jgi:hypothetical protein